MAPASALLALMPSRFTSSRYRFPYCVPLSTTDWEGT